MTLSHTLLGWIHAYLYWCAPTDMHINYCTRTWVLWARRAYSIASLCLEDFGLVLWHINHCRFVVYYIYTYENHTIQIHRRLRCSGTNVLLTSDFSSSTRGERDIILKSLSYHTMLTTPPTFGTSHGVLDLNSSSLVGTRKT